MSDPLEEPLDEFFNRVTALNDVSLRDQVPGGIPETHTTIPQPAARKGSTPIEFTGIELTPTALRHSMEQSCTVVVDVATQQLQACLPRSLAAKWSRVYVHEAHALKGSVVLEEKCGL